MTQYINKVAVIVEIESYINSFCDRNGYLEDAETNSLTYETLCNLKNSIDDLEVKEVDLEKELSYEDYTKFFEEHPSFSDDWGFDEAWVFAQHFFELGLNAAQKRE